MPVRYQLVKSGENNKSIDAVRTIAALLVVMEHVRALMFQDWAGASHTPVNAVFYFITGLGADAVVVFFVLSGFWVGGSVLRSTSRNRFRWRDYLISRGARLWIALIPAVLLTVLLASIGLAFFPSTDVFGGHPGYHSLVDGDIEEDIKPLVVLGNLFFLQGIAVPVIGTNGPLWSLAYEFWYYVLFPALLVAVTRGSVVRRLLHAAVGIAIAVMVGGEILALFPVWLLGAAIAYFRVQIAAFLRRMHAKASLLQLAGGILLLAAIAFVDVSGWPAPVSAWVVAIPAALFIATLVNDVAMNNWWFAPLRGASEYAQVSYSLYVMHLPVAIFGFALLMPFASDRLQPTPFALMAYVAVILVLMILGWTFGWLTELRTAQLRRSLDLVLPGRKPAPVGPHVPGA